ncbi:thioester reductase domain-containing protein [Streptomyces albicerus]|uniref:thioester reductase domain-containing protein n=1 Tax=Streptomyces albicerus TaxID=2569859 RepID=UPI001788D8A0|nr:thioester reductase domain-containing protein [Streptomyces albicerus]
MTGATGWLGGYLCAELARRTLAVVYALVRANSHTTAHQRLTDRLRLLGLANQVGERVIAVPGDLLRPRFGLPAHDHDALAETVDAIFHSAASVNLAAPYEDAAQINIGGVRTVVELAERRTELTGHPPRLHHISTLGAIGGLRTEADERTPAASHTAATGVAYARTKAVAEQEVLAAQARGTPVTILRPGLITADYTTGHTWESDLLVPLLRASVAVGHYPDPAGHVPADTIDTVAAATVALARRPAITAQTFHLARPAPLAITTALAALCRAGYPLSPMPRDAWQRLVDDRADDPAVLPMAALHEAGRYLLASDPAHVIPPIRCDRTWTALAEAGITPPPLDDAYFDRVAAALISDQLLPPAPGAQPTGRQPCPASTR